MPDLSIIVPTYCEAENLPELVDRIWQAVQAAGITAEILVVDDDSPDATVATCAELYQEFPLRLIVRKGERGLASAVVRGMSEAEGDVLLCMDADLSHPPEKIPELWRTLAEDEATDFVIGSRYVAGGGTDEDWGWFRRLNSQAATLLARPLTKAMDPMAGFFALRRPTFEQADALDPVGFKIGLELIVKCNCRNVVEVPIQFHDRKHGTSKLGLQEQLNYLRHLQRLYAYRYQNLTWFAMFGCVGLSGFGVDVLLFFLLLKILSVGAAGAIAIAGAMTWNYILNRTITFRGTQRKPWLTQYLLFCASCSLGAAFNWLTRVALISQTTFFRDAPLLAAVVGVAAGMVFNFLLCRFFVFADPKGLFAAHERQHTVPNESALARVSQSGE